MVCRRVAESMKTRAEALALGYRVAPGASHRIRCPEDGN